MKAVVKTAPDAATIQITGEIDVVPGDYEAEVFRDKILLMRRWNPQEVLPVDKEDEDYYSWERPAQAYFPEFPERQLSQLPKDFFDGPELTGWFERLPQGESPPIPEI